MAQSKTPSVYPPEVAARFWSHVAVGERGECWLWLQSTAKHGYGQTWDGQNVVLAHRMAWELVHGPIPRGMSVLHHCDVRACVNAYDHMFLGTDADNAMDKARKLRIPIAKLNPDIVREMRRRYAEGGVSTRQLADEYGVDRRAIVFALKGETWTHVEGGEIEQLGDHRRVRKGKGNPARKVQKTPKIPAPRRGYRRVPQETAIAILADVASGMPKLQAARLHGVNRKTVDAILNRLKEAA